MRMVTQDDRKKREMTPSQHKMCKIKFNNPLKCKRIDNDMMCFDS